MKRQVINFYHSESIDEENTVFDKRKQFQNTKKVYKFKVEIIKK